MKSISQRMKYEFKYLVSNDKLPVLRSLLQPYVCTDKYMNYSGKDGYTVRSIYFDTPQFCYYQEKKEGIKKRKKVRIRGYNDCNSDSIVFLEIKRKNGKLVSKNRAPVLYRDLKSVISNNCDPERYIVPDCGFDNAVDDARRFMFNLHRYNLKPTVRVIYKREAYSGKCDRSLRLTIDKELRGSIFPKIDRLYDENNIKYSIPGYFVFEVKFYDVFPAWLRKIIVLLDLKLESFSKFATCIEEHVDVDDITPYMLSHFVHALRI